MNARDKSINITKIKKATTALLRDKFNRFFI